MPYWNICFGFFFFLFFFFFFFFHSWCFSWPNKMHTGWISWFTRVYPFILFLFLSLFFLVFFFLLTFLITFHLWHSFFYFVWVLYFLFLFFPYSSYSPLWFLLLLYGHCWIHSFRSYKYTHTHRQTDRLPLAQISSKMENGYRNKWYMNWCESLEKFTGLK